MSKLRVTVNTAKCQSYRRCVAIAPAVFAIQADGKATVIEPRGDPNASAPEAAMGGSREEVVKAARSCPYRAIVVVDETSGEQLFPPVRKPSGGP